MQKIKGRAAVLVQKNRRNPPHRTADNAYASFVSERPGLSPWNVEDHVNGAGFQAENARRRGVEQHERELAGAKAVQAIGAKVRLQARAGEGLLRLRGGRL